MKVTCKRKALLVAAQDAQRCCEKKGYKPILGNVLLTAGPGDVISLKATDLEIGTIINVAADVQEQGTYAVPAAKLATILKASTGADVLIETASTDSNPFVLGLTIGASKYRVLCEDPAEFLFYGGIDQLQSNVLSIPAQTLRTMIGQTLFATDTEALRYALNGGLLELADGVLRLVATNGRRLAVAKTLLQGPVEAFSVIVPKKALSELYRALKDEDGEVSIETPKPKPVKVDPTGNRPVETDQSPESDTDNWYLVIFRLQDRVIMSRLLDGKFPPWREVIPENADKTATINVKALLQGIKQVRILTSELSNGVGFIFQHNELIVKASSAENGDAEVTIPVVYDGPNTLPVTFNPEYVFEFLATVETDEVGLRFIDEKTQVAFTSGDTMYVVMPIVPREEPKAEEVEETVKVGREPWPNGLGATFTDVDGGYHEVARNADGMYHSAYYPGEDFTEPTRIGQGASDYEAMDNENPVESPEPVDASAEPVEYEAQGIEVEPIAA